ncbi:D-alanyl-D-alanine carboxypeptidase [Herbidospora sp. NEAU-GS84]|uniref:D-alanyl-D-alanine carboxypeptidase n=1 Tax=Herbidospora solisilvae TaxID=2696284 RepID=A0A7C9J5Z8_9ACTN|nr:MULTISPECIES: serine hydrolase [Herbidospora]NAS25627.1 D-alanyl-D-alanine carboxypeptidase [Herbidospora solisilvae]
MRRCTSALSLAVLTAGLVAGTQPAALAADVIGGPQLAGTGIIVPAGVQAPPKTKASSYVIADADTGEVLAAKNPHGRFLPASTLKALTALTLIPLLDKNKTVKPSQAAVNEEGSAVGLVPKPIYKVHDLLRALMMVSGNDCANALAEANGGIPATLADMNEVARKLQANDTVAKTPSGLDKPGQSSSAYDLALIARAGLKLKDFREYISTKTAKFPAPKGHYEIGNHNKMLWTYDGMLGVKNGWTSKAFGSFVGAAKRDGHTIIVSVMRHEESFWKDVEELMNWGFANRGKSAAVGALVEPLPDRPSPAPSALAAERAPVPEGNAAVSAPDARESGSGMMATIVLGGGLVAGVGLLGWGIRRKRRQSPTASS